MSTCIEEILGDNRKKVITLDQLQYIKDYIDGHDSYLAKLFKDGDDDLRAELEFKINYESERFDAELLAKYRESLAEAQKQLDKLRDDLIKLIYDQDKENDSDVQAAIDAAIAAVNATLNDRFKLMSDDLQKQLEDALNNGDGEAIKKLQDEIARLNKDNADFREALEQLKNDNGNNGDGGNSALTPEDFEELLRAALIDGTTISGKGIETPKLMAQKIVALVGLFGTITASKLSATDIEGYNVSSPLDEYDEETGERIILKDENNNTVYETVKDENGDDLRDNNGNIVYVQQLNPYTNELEKIPVYKKKTIDEAAWALKKDGSGHLANGKISWNAKGDVTLTGVTLDWDNITGDKPTSGTGTDGVSSFVSTVFLRSNEEPDTPIGGSFEKPYPTEIIEDGKTIKWSDDIPTDSMNILWASTKVFYSDGRTDGDEYPWSEPAQMTDTSSFEVIYGVESAETDITKLPDLNSLSSFVNGTNGWYDDTTDVPAGETIYYMATATCNNGEWSKWTVSKIKGENGEKGGSVKLAGRFETLEALKSAIQGEPDDHDAAYIITNGPEVDGHPMWYNHLFVWLGENPSDSYDPDNGDYNYYGWYDSGQFNGKDGLSAYVHIKYAKSLTYDETGKVTGGVLNGEKGESATGASFIGVYNDHNEDDPTLENDNSENWGRYQWSKLPDEETIKATVTSHLSTYHVTSEHIAGKTVDSAYVDDNEESDHYNPNAYCYPAKLVEGTKVTLYEQTNYGSWDEETAEIITVEEGQEVYGPAWQLRKDGDGYLANGNIRWDEDGKVTFGPGVELKWDSITGAPELGEGGLSEDTVKGLISTEISQYKITSANIEAGTRLSGAIVSSLPKTSGVKDYSWEIKNDGAGYLADGAIEWDAPNNGTTELRINGTAIMNGIINDDTAKGRFEELVAEKIDATTINTTELNTVPSNDNDRIHIADNYIECITSEGEKTLDISSNEVDTYIEDFINSVISAGSTMETVSNSGTTDKTGAIIKLPVIDSNDYPNLDDTYKIMRLPYGENYYNFYIEELDDYEKLFSTDGGWKYKDDNGDIQYLDYDETNGSVLHVDDVMGSGHNHFIRNWVNNENNTPLIIEIGELNKNTTYDLSISDVTARLGILSGSYELNGNTGYLRMLTSSRQWHFQPHEDGKLIGLKLQRSTNKVIWEDVLNKDNTPVICEMSSWNEETVKENDTETGGVINNKLTYGSGYTATSISNAVITTPDDQKYNYRFILDIPIDSIEIYYNRGWKDFSDSTGALSQYIFNGDNAFVDLELQMNATVVTTEHLPVGLTTIGKNGMIVSNENKVLAIDGSAVSMLVKLDVTNDTAAFGVRVTDEGIFIADGEPIGENRSSIWNQLDIQKLWELGLLK